MSARIEIDDLLEPRLSEVQLAALAYGAAQPVVLSVDAVLSSACARTGLRDFGPDDFRERLALLLQEWNSDTEMLGLHRMVLRQYVDRYASNRLLIHDILRRHPEIHDEVIERPIIVAGLPRSGTTHLVNLLAADHQLHALPLWEAYEPLPIPGEPITPGGIDPRYQRCADAWEGLRTTAPLIAAMHPMEPDHIHEDLELMQPDFASYNFEWLSRVPKWRDRYFATDQTPHYAYMKTVFKILQWQRGPKRWVMKCPQHLEQLPVLRTIFPDATIVITHRDPVAVIQSAVTMIAYGERIRHPHVDARGIRAYWVDRVEHLLRACVRDRALWPEEQSIDVPFNRFMADEWAMVGQIYRTAGLPLTSAARSQIGEYIAAHPRGKEGQVVYHLERDFGVSPETLRKRFQFYYDAFPFVAS